MEVSNNLANNVATSDSTNSAASLAENFDTFLTLLTTQLRYQDPLEPLESNEFVSQLVDFTNVEQSIATNKNLEQLLALQTTNQMVGALGFIGQTVEAATDQLPLVDGQAKITYGLSDTAANATILVSDASGQIVFSAPAETAAGKHSFTWNGEGLNGATLPNGLYKVSVVAKDAENKDIDTATGVVAKVTGIDTTEDGFVLRLGPAQVPVTAVVSVEDTQSAETDTSPDPDDGAV